MHFVAVIDVMMLASDLPLYVPTFMYSLQFLVFCSLCH